LALVPTGRPAAGQPGSCVVHAPTYHKSPPLSVLWSMFLHAGWLHLLGNMLFLVVFGNNIEDRMRKLPYLVFYLASGYVAAYGFALAYPSSIAPLIGASGAISGILGAYLVLYPRARVWSLVPFLLFLPLRIPAWIVLGLWFALQWAYSAGMAAPGAGSVAYLAHVFGFVAGALVGLVLRALGDSSDPRLRQRRAAG
jgi:membrane associated rhomboid family serine protease